MSTSPALHVAIKHQVGSFKLQAEFSAAPGLTAFFGRSGSGKTTLVNRILTSHEHGKRIVVIENEAGADKEAMI